MLTGTCARFLWCVKDDLEMLQVTRARDLKLTMSVRELKLPAECGEDPVIATVSIGTVDWSSSSDTSSSFPTLDTGHLIQSHTDTKYIIMGNDRNDTNQQRIKFVNLKSIIFLTVHHLSYLTLVSPGDLGSCGLAWNASEASNIFYPLDNISSIIISSDWIFSS